MEMTKSRLCVGQANQPHKKKNSYRGMQTNETKQVTERWKLVCSFAPHGAGGRGDAHDVGRSLNSQKIVNRGMIDIA